MPLLFVVIFTCHPSAQTFYFGADQSYVNEMENCGAIYTEEGQAKDIYDIFADHGCNLVRLRLWHTPNWYDNLNDGSRFGDLADVKKSIARAHAQGMEVLLDFHLSDNWADPGSQLVPAAWLDIVDNLPVLKDSLYSYILHTLIELRQENLLPEMVQIGNETNKGILLSPQDNQTWTLDWPRNAQLFNAGIQAVRDVEMTTGSDIEIVIHIAGPDNAGWLMEGFHNNGVTDFDIIGLSYYWQWHQPTDIDDTGDIITTLKSTYPGKEVLIVETGYMWTTNWNDNANNVLNQVHPDYSPASPINQRDWLIALTEEVIAHEGLGVVYWEPAWVSTSCSTQWGQGSHYEQATFFDFDNNLLLPGGIEWMEHDYGLTTSNQERSIRPNLQIQTNGFNGAITIVMEEIPKAQTYQYQIFDTAGQALQTGFLTNQTTELQLGAIPSGLYIISVRGPGEVLLSQKMLYAHP
jgi:arabinogalactan endo-1,4-beta-galactosidase